MARRPGLYPLDRAVPDPRLTPIAPEADVGFAAGADLDDDDGDAFARLREVGRLLDTVRVIDQLRELGALDPGQLRDLSQWIEGGGLAAGQARWPNAFWGSRPGGGDRLGDLRIPGLSNLGPSEMLGNRGSGFGMDHRAYDPDAQRGSRDPFGIGLGLVSDGAAFSNRLLAEKYGFLAPPLGPLASGGPPQQPRADSGGSGGGADAGVDARADAGVDAGRDAGSDAAASSSTDAGGGADAMTTEEWLISEGGFPLTSEDFGGAPVAPGAIGFDYDGDGVIDSVWVPEPDERPAHPDAGRDPDENSGPADYTGLIARLLARLPVNWTPSPPNGGGRRVRPIGAGDEGVGPSPRLVIGGLADEPVRSRHRSRVSTRRLHEAFARIMGTVDGPRRPG